MGQKRAGVSLCWCRVHGGDEFRLTFVGPQGAPPDQWAKFDRALALFRLPHQKGCERFLLSADSAAALRGVLDDGLFTYDPGADACVEDRKFYRSGHRFLSIITHEGEGSLEIEPAEQATLDVAGLPYHLKNRWK